MDSNEIIVSVIIPCYNQALYLEEAIESVINQTFTKWECIVINDGSTDNTEEVIQPYLQHPKIRYIRQDNSGVSSARNYAVNSAKGEYILPLDGDDVLHKDFIGKLYNAFSQNKNVKLAYTPPVFFGERNGRPRFRPYSYTTLLIENMIVVTALFKRSDFLACGGYDETFDVGWEDWEFWIRFLRPEDTVINLREDLFFYRIKSVSRNALIDEQKGVQVRRTIFRKHLEKYLTYLPDPISIAKENMDLKRVYIDPPDYKVGHFVLKPIRGLKGLCRGIYLRTTGHFANFKRLVSGA